MQHPQIKRTQVIVIALSIVMLLLVASSVYLLSTPASETENSTEVETDSLGLYKERIKNGECEAVANDAEKSLDELRAGEDKILLQETIKIIVDCRLALSQSEGVIVYVDEGLKLAKTTGQYEDYFRDLKVSIKQEEAYNKASETIPKAEELKEEQDALR